MRSVSVVDKMKYHPFYSCRGVLLFIVAILTVISSYVTIPIIRTNKHMSRNICKVRMFPAVLQIFKGHPLPVTNVPHDVHSVSNIGLDIVKLMANLLKASKHPSVLFVVAWWNKGM